MIAYRLLSSKCFKRFIQASKIANETNRNLGFIQPGGIDPLSNKGMLKNENNIYCTFVKFFNFT
jgi:hypothetical protein